MRKEIKRCLFKSSKNAIQTGSGKGNVKITVNWTSLDGAT